MGADIRGCLPGKKELRSVVRRISAVIRLAELISLAESVPFPWNAFKCSGSSSDPCASVVRYDGIAVRVDTDSCVLLDVNPGGSAVLLKLFDDMSDSGLQMDSRRGIFTPLLIPLLLIKQFKLHLCKLLLRLDIRLLHKQETLNQIWFALT